MRYPEFLPNNGTIGFLAPSFGCATEPYKSAFDHALEVFHQMGYRTVLGPNCYASDGIGISNKPEVCGQEVMEMFADETTDVLISCGGGELMCEVLDHIDFGRLNELPPKYFMGYSDNTNLTFLLATLCDTASIYGPCAGTFGMKKWHPSLEDSLQLLQGIKNEVHNYDGWEKESLKDEEHPLAPYHITEPYSQVIYDPENRSSFTMSGRLLGGCLDIMSLLLGTKYDKVKEFGERYKEDGILWFIEACDLNVLSIRRALWQMAHAGWFEHVKGFLIGRPRIGEDMMGLDRFEAVLEHLRQYKVPVVMDVDLGHVAPMMPVVVGSVGEVTVYGNQLKLCMKQI